MHMEYTERQLSLCERILEHCQEQRWFGPDDDNPSLFSDRYRRSYNIFSRECIVEDRWDDARLLRFAFPPATPEQLAVTEQSLGFPLPTMLHALYSKVANGGFGPGAGITGGYGGYTCMDDGRDETVDKCNDADVSIHYFNLAQYEVIRGAPRHLLLPPNSWPSNFLHLTYWGCNIDSYIEAYSGRVYYSSLWDFVKTASGFESYMHLYRQEESLEDWLETWLRHDWTAPELAPKRWFDFESVPMVAYLPDVIEEG